MTFWKVLAAIALAFFIITHISGDAWMIIMILAMKAGQYLLNCLGLQNPDFFAIVGADVLFVIGVVALLSSKLWLPKAKLSLASTKAFLKQPPVFLLKKAGAALIGWLVIYGFFRLLDLAFQPQSDGIDKVVTRW